jgi:hypothetical protein
MRRLIVFCVFCACLLISLSGCFRDLLLENTETKEKWDKIKTYVRFINEGDFPVDVFTSVDRLSKICPVDAKGSRAVEVFSVNETVYYLTYRIPFHGASLAYNYYMSLNITAEKTTDGHIPRLSELSAADQQKPLNNDVYIYIDNTSSSSLSLQRGSTPIKLEDSSAFILNGRSRGV